MGSIDPSLDFWMNSTNQQKMHLDMQIRQAEANLHSIAAKYKYAHGWHDPRGTVSVFGGTDPQKAFVDIQNDPESISHHLLSQNIIKPKVRVSTHIYFVFIGVAFIVLAIVLKQSGG